MLLGVYVKPGGVTALKATVVVKAYPSRHFLAMGIGCQWALPLSTQGLLCSDKDCMRTA